MSKVYDEIYKRIVVLVNFWNNNSGLLSENETVAAYFSALIYYKKLLDEINVELVNFNGIMPKYKQQVKKTLVESIRIVSFFITLYYSSKEDLANAEIYKRYARSIYKMKDKELYQKGKALVKKSGEISDLVAVTKMPLRILDELKLNVDELYDIISERSDDSYRKKALYNERNKISSKANDDIRKKLSVFMKVFYEKSNPELYKDYQIASKRVTIPRKKVAIKGMITDKETKEALDNVIITIPERNLRKICRSKKGEYKIKSLPSGVYDFEVMKTNYKCFKAKLVYEKGETVILNIELEPNKSSRS